MPVTTESRPGGIQLLTFRNPPVNALSTTLQSEISTTLKSLYTDPTTKAVVIYGDATHGFFSSGADINEFSRITSGSSPFTPDARWCYTGAENGPVPVVAAIGGSCFGGGCELAMCCSARVANDKAKFGLPELQLGIIPGLGGTQRLPRLVGMRKGLEMMISSKPIGVKEAKEHYLVDEVVSGSNEELIEVACRVARDIAEGRKKRIKTIELESRLESVQECKQIVQGMKKMIAKMSKNGALKQYEQCVKVALHGVMYGGKEGLKAEERAFAKLVTSPESKSIVHMFFAARNTTKVKLDNDASPRSSGVVPKKLGIIGGGLMGAGIATATLQAGIPVIIKEINEKCAESAVARVKRNLGPKGAALMSKLTLTTEYGPLSTVDMVIEAALENPMIKRQIFKDLDEVISSNCILSTNTSTLNIDMVGQAAPKAHGSGRILGCHFFSPAHKMPLLEVVHTPSTSISTIKNTLALGKKIRKTPVLVGNCTGFAVNRMYFPQGQVANYLLTGLCQDPYQVDRALERFGAPMGPFRLADLVGIDIAAAIDTVFSAAYADRAGPSSMSGLFVAAGRKGQKSQQGFYTYSKGSRMGMPDPQGISGLVEQARASSPFAVKKSVHLSDQEIVEMLLLPCVNEGMRILEEGVAQSSSDLDVCSVMGMGFPSHRGGLMHWASTLGSAKYLVERLNHYYERFDQFPLFKPSFALVRAAAAAAPVGEIIRPSRMIGSPNDTVIVAGVRTAVGRAARGGFRSTSWDNLVLPVLSELLKRSGVPAGDIDDVIMGTVLPQGDIAVMQLRVAGILAGLPVSVPVKVINRLCSSGLQAIVDASNSIQAGVADVVIAGGCESMSEQAYKNRTLPKMNEKAKGNRNAMSSYMTMGMTSETVAKRYGVSRERQDRMAVISHARASACMLSGKQRNEIVPVKTTVEMRDKETRKVTGTKDVVVDTDEGVRMGVTMARLSKLKPSFKKDGSTTAGNASQLSDGCAGVIVMKRSEAYKRQLNVLGSLKAYAVVGVDPSVMGIGPALAIPAVLKKAGLRTEDIDLYEINEAFGSQSEYCISKLGLNRDIVNLNGGAIAIGHPLGMTGARLTVSILNELHRRKGRYGVVSMCIGTGMGAAAVFEISSMDRNAKL
eukprot:Plantae.Rhodophyta-Hildenbrandia_rubra.ctg539.p2 GENE.Plantae.Rhodophyta-Hildenbrandia_rubra.ctg539~~Plantae.Rhodophyta-Hildenbrandia_rubra.ctg539.p2  ORF type:complete len:1127 (+),score=227.39 Plantae.Rhodophyta-Hildenbrandia_rubra.ctg539:9624-13004(+)